MRFSRGRPADCDKLAQHCMQLSWHGMQCLCIWMGGCGDAIGQLCTASGHPSLVMLGRNFTKIILKAGMHCVLRVAGNGLRHCTCNQVTPVVPTTSTQLSNPACVMPCLLCRQLNEALYTQPGDASFSTMQEQPELFEQYHEGFQQQVRASAMNSAETWWIKRCKALGVGQPLGQHRWLP